MVLGDFSTFIHQTYLYIEGNLLMLNMDKMKIMFVLSYMHGGRAGDWSDDYINQWIKDSTWPKYEDFMKELKV